jgi:hypothetical protein
MIAASFIVVILALLTNIIFPYLIKTEIDLPQSNLKIPMPPVKSPKS